MLAGMFSRAGAQGIGKVARMITGSTAGVGLDPFARQLADKMRGVYAPNVIVENRPGAGNRLAVDAMRSAPADGTAMLFTPASPITIYPHLYKSLPYDPFKDLIAVSTTFTFKMGLVVGPACPARTLAEYLEWIKANPKNASYGTPGAGTVPHFLAVNFGQQAGVTLVHVPYKGAAYWQDILGGQLPAVFSPISRDTVGRHQDGKVRILAMAEQSRTKRLPQVPTFAESGFPKLVIDEWFGIFLPAATPPQIVTALNQALTTALREPEVVRMLDLFDSEPQPITPADFATRVRADYEFWASTVRSSGFKLDD